MNLYFLRTPDFRIGDLIKIDNIMCMVVWVEDVKMNGKDATMLKVEPTSKEV